MKAEFMTEWDASRIRDILGLCGERAMASFRKVKWRLKEDDSLVTEADMEVESILDREFNHPDKGSYIIGEETVSKKSESYVSKAFQNTAWIVDPIDGTAPFAHGIDTWGISIGFMRDGVLEEGALYLPARGEIFITDKSDIYAGMSRNCESLPALSKFTSSKASLSHGGLVSISQNIARTGTLSMKNPLHAICCSVFSSACLLQGSYMAYLGCAKLWDIAGALPILWNCGYETELFSGRTISRTISEATCELSPDSGRRWFMKDLILIAPDQDIIRYVRKSVLDKGI